MSPLVGPDRACCRWSDLSSEPNDASCEEQRMSEGRPDSAGGAGTGGGGAVGSRFHRAGAADTGAAGRLAAIDHVVVLMLENRSFDHMLGFLYTDEGNVSPAGHPFEGLTGKESNPDVHGTKVPVFRIDTTAPRGYFMPG